MTADLFSIRPLLRLLAALCLAALLAACGVRVELVSQVSESQANEVLAALMKQGITADKISGKEGKVSLQVPQDRVAEAIAIMQANGLPRETHVRMGDVFKKEGLISSPLEERARMVYALSQELAGTIAKIDGVIDASVHVVLPERGGFGEPSNPSSAAVFIKHLDTAPMDSVVPQIRRLVTNSISGLSYDNVSVVLVPAAPLSNAMSGSSEPAESVQRVWGIEVADDSATSLRAVLIVLILLLVASIGGAVFLFLRGRPATARTHA